MQLNRAQRRAAAKAKPQRVLNKSAVAQQIYTTLFCASIRDIDEEQHSTLVAPFYATLDTLRSGDLDLDGYIRLNEANMFGFCLAKRLHQFAADETTRQILEPSQHAFEHAAEQIYLLGLRHEKTSRWTAKADELAAMRTSLQWLDELIKVSPEGHALKAMRQAEHEVRVAWTKKPIKDHTA